MTTNPRIMAAALAAAALLALTACGGKDDDSKAPSTPSADTSSIEATAGIPAAPTGEQLKLYLAALQAVDSGLVVDQDKAIRNGRNQCQALTTGTANPDRAAAQRFGTDDRPLTDAQGKTINLALRTTFCPKS